MNGRVYIVIIRYAGFVCCEAIKNSYNIKYEFSPGNSALPVNSRTEKIIF